MGSIALTCGLMGIAMHATSGERAVVEAILIRVNDRIVTVADFKQRLNMELSQLAAQPEGEQLRAYAKTLFDTMVEELVLLERADEKRMTIDEETVDRAIQTLREENNLLDEKEFEEAVASTGMTLEQLRERYRQTILLQRAVSGDITPTEITEEELRRIYEQEMERYRVPKKIELEQLFFPLDPEGGDSLEALERRVKGLIERVSGGTDLTAEATLAGVEIQQLGAIPEEDLRPELRDALTGVSENGLSPALATAGGLQVLRLVRRIPAGYQPFEEVKEALRRRESQKAFHAQTRGIVERLKVEYLVEVHRERLALVFQGGDDA